MILYFSTRKFLVSDKLFSERTKGRSGVLDEERC